MTGIIEGKSARLLQASLLAATILMAACASYSRTVVPPGDVPSVLAVGDEVEITRRDGTTAFLKIRAISDTAVSGSLLTNVFGRHVSIPISEIASATRYTRAGIDTRVTAEVLGGVLGIALVIWLL